MPKIQYGVIVLGCYRKLLPGSALVPSHYLNQYVDKSFIIYIWKINIYQNVLIYDITFENSTWKNVFLSRTSGCGAYTYVQSYMEFKLASYNL